jgi:3-phosphoshikimate 1-carboxyvinyltransferase
MATELRKLGATVEEGADFIRVYAARLGQLPAPGGDRHLRRSPHGHVLSLAALATPLRINDPG